VTKVLDPMQLTSSPDLYWWYSLLGFIQCACLFPKCPLKRVQCACLSLKCP